ncbi:uncharacterized protein G2W53_022266 [Senna tora]|uniref:Uncharacterized protein n=1 Tax=Senna tora TaxID=362788 RepID=A0A834WIL3_9FABA|nr:uncharacterized protein G2W53_022266 [Senna tora]
MSAAIDLEEASSSRSEISTTFSDLPLPLVRRADFLTYGDALLDFLPPLTIFLFPPLEGSGTSSAPNVTLALELSTLPFIFFYFNSHVFSNNRDNHPIQQEVQIEVARLVLTPNFQTPEDTDPPWGLLLRAES